MRKKKEDFFFTGLSLCTTDRRLGGMWRDLIRGCFFFFVFVLSSVDLPAGAALCRHAGIVFKDDVAVVVKVEERQRWEDVWDTTRSRHLWMAADSVHDTLDGSVIRRVQFLSRNR